MSATNCWEFFNCGREPGGAHTSEQGVCPAAANPALFGVNGGRNGGRMCWGATGRLDGDEPCERCANCAFYKTVCEEQGPSFRSFKEARWRLKAS